MKWFTSSLTSRQYKFDSKQSQMWSLRYYKLWTCGKKGLLCNIVSLIYQKNAINIYLYGGVKVKIQTKRAKFCQESNIEYNFKMSICVLVFPFFHC